MKTAAASTGPVFRPPGVIIPLVPLRCPTCHQVLVLCQPGEHEPARILGACPRMTCLTWWAISADDPDPSHWTIGERLVAWPVAESPDAPSG